MKKVDFDQFVGKIQNSKVFQKLDFWNSVQDSRFF